MLYAADYKFWREYVGDIRRHFRGECWTVSETASALWGLYFVRISEGDGLCRDPTLIYGGKNSGYQAAHLACNFIGAMLPGFTGGRVGLLGYDMQRTGGASHNHGDHRGKLRNGQNFAEWIQRFGTFAKHARAAGVEVVNCSRATALTCFPRMTIEEFLR